MIGESAVSFACDGDPLYGVLHRPEQPLKKGLVVVVGGPQYRVGSHRQFVLLARALAQSGVAVLRFDYRGMGDSGGAPRDFEHIHDDIRAAIDALLQRVPDVREVVLWGLCDAASAMLFYAAGDPRVSGLVLLNPWVRTEQTVARAYLRHYYLGRLRDPNFWRKFVRGELRPAGAWRSLFGMLRRAWRRPAPVAGGTVAAARGSLPDRMLAGLESFGGRVLLILSGDDLTANEFKDMTARAAGWKNALAQARIVRRELPAANHTFSRRDWRDQVSRWTLEWLRGW